MRVRLQELGRVITGNTPSKSVTEYWLSPDICFIKPDSIRDYGITEISGSKEHLSNCARSKARIVGKSAVLVTCIGSIGKIGITASGEYAFNQQINAIEPNNKINPRYLAYALLFAKSRLIEIANAPVVPIINKAQFGDFELSIESDLSKQVSIVQTLDTVSKIIAMRQRQLRTLDTLIKARFVEMFGECSKTVPIGESGLTISDGNYSSKYPRSDEFVERGIPFIRANNMRNGTIFDDDMYYITPEKHSLLLKGHLKANDILVSTRGNIGIIALVPDRHTDSNINAQIVLLRDEVGRFIPHYLLWALQTESAKTQFSRLQTGTALKQLPVGRLEQVVIQEPPLSEQRVFSDFAKQVDKSKVVVQKALDEAQLLYDSLMQKYFE